MMAASILKMRPSLIRLLYPYGSVARVWRGPSRGSRFVVAPGIGVSYAFGTRDAAPRHFAKFVCRGATVYDVGANKGQMTLLFASLAGPTGRVVAFEPVPEEFARLEHNVALNHLPGVRLINAAVSDNDGQFAFTYADERPTQGKLRDVERTYDNPGARTFNVAAVTLDTVAKVEPPPDVIKIDVEGAAAAVLRGARDLLDRHRPTIYVELHGPEEQRGIRDELLSRGYEARMLDGTPVTDPTSGWFSPLWCHWPTGA